MGSYQGVASRGVIKGLRHVLNIVKPVHMYHAIVLMWLIKGLCLGYKYCKPCVPGARYMRLISWTLLSGSKQ